MTSESAWTALLMPTSLLAAGSTMQEERVHDTLLRCCIELDLTRPAVPGAEKYMIALGRLQVPSPGKVVKRRAATRLNAPSVIMAAP